VAHFLKERGLELSHEKTQITHIEAGFDLGVTTAFHLPTDGGGSYFSML
jgi:hypothetical protein